MTLPVLWAGRVYGAPNDEVAFTSKQCVPTAVLTGAPELVSPLANELRMLGVASEATPDCPAVTADVERGRSGFTISLREPNGRHVTRNLSDLRISATWIDSWLHQDLGASLLAARLPPTPAASVSSEQTAATAPALSSRRYQATMGYESITRDRSVPWQGARGGLCTNLGPSCVGMQVALARRASEYSLENELFEFSERSVDLLAAIQWPIELGRTTLSPHLAIGAGWFETKRAGIPTCPVDGANCPPEPEAMDAARRGTWSPRADAGLALSLPIASALHLRLGGGVGYRPLAAPAQRTEDNSEECLDPADPACTQPEIPGLLSFAKEPSTSWRLFIGLQVHL